MNDIKKDIRQCPLYGGRYWADREGNVYLDAEGKQKVGVCFTHNSHKHVHTTTAPYGLIHRIVYYAFHNDAPVKGYDIHHLNEVKTDNRLENLQLLTHSEHASLHMTGKYVGEKNPNYGKFGEKHPMYGRRGEKNHNYGAKSPQAKPVLQYTKEGVFVAEYPCTKSAERATGTPCQNISAVCNHKPYYNTAGGYIWRFKDDPLPPKNDLPLF